MQCMAVGHVQTEFCLLFTLCLPNLLFPEEMEEEVEMMLRGYWNGITLLLIMEATSAEHFSLSTTV